jgi:intraflagellar transport protein 80
MWNLSKNETTNVANVPQEVFPTGMEWPPRSQPGAAGGVRKSTDLLLITAADGHFHLLGRGGRIEKSVQGHQGTLRTFPLIFLHTIFTA